MRKNYWIYYSICFAAFAAVIFLPFFIKGNSLILIGDGYNSFYPILCYIGRYLRDFLAGTKSYLQYDFSIGLGEPVISLLNVSGFGEVTNLLSVFFDNEHTVYLYSFLQILRLYLSGMSFSIYAFNHSQSPRAILAGSMTYAFSMFSLTQGINFPTFLFPMITLPLIILGIEKIIEDRHAFSISPMFMVAIFLQALCGYYFLYMETLVIIVYFVVCFGKRSDYVVKEKRYRIFMLKMLSVSVQYIIGIMMASLFFAPSVMGFFNSTRTGSKKYMLSELFFLPNWKTYLENIGGIVSLNGSGLHLCIPVLGVIGILWLFSEKKYSHIKVCLCIFAAGIFFPVIGYFMTAFSTLGYRWVFVIYFWMAYMISLTVDSVQTINRKVVIWGLCIAFLFNLCNLLVDPISSETLLRFSYYIVIIVIYAVCFCLAADVQIKRFSNTTVHKIVLWTLLGNVCMNGFLLNAPRVMGGLGNSAAFMSNQEVISDMEKSFINDLPKAQEFCRYDIYDASLSASLALDYNSTVAYYSVLNQYISEFFQEMYISPGVRSASFILKGLDSRQIMESLLSVKYYTDYEIQSDGERKQVIVENREFLPLGFTYKNSISRDQVNQMNPLDKAETMLQAVVLENDSKTGTGKEAQLSYSAYEIPCIVKMDDVKKGTEDFEVSEDSKIDITFEPSDCDGELYVNIQRFFLQSSGTRDVVVGNKDIQLRNPKDDYYCGTEDFWIKVELPEIKNNHITISFDQAGKYTLGDIKMFFYPTDKLSEQINKLRESTFTNTSFEEGKLSADIFANGDEYLFLSIPYSQGWSATLDGEKVKIHRANIAFMAIPLKMGEHHIELYYTPPGLIQGVWLSIIGVITFIILCSIKRVYYNQKGSRK